MNLFILNKLLAAITWTLVHSLWQGLTVAILAGAILLLTKHSTAARRYSLLLGLFATFLAGAVVTFFIEYNSHVKPVEQVDIVGFTFLSQWLEQATVFLNNHSIWIALGWFIIFLFKSERMIKDMAAIKSFCKSNTQEPEPRWLLKMQSLSNAMAIRKTVQLLESTRVKVPVVIGHLKPLILVPVGLLNNLPPAQVEAVLLHELAHIRRHDYLVNLLQRLSELVFFFNPALLWLSSLLRVERESCCDEMAINHTGNKLQFAEALIYCKEYSMRIPNYAMGFFGQKKLLFHRLDRIVSNRNKTLSRFEFGFVSLSLILLSCLLMNTGQIPRMARPDRVQVIDLVSNGTKQDPDQLDKDQAQLAAESAQAKRIDVNVLLTP